MTLTFWTWFGAALVSSTLLLIGLDLAWETARRWYRRSQVRRELERDWLTVVVRMGKRS